VRLRGLPRRPVQGANVSGPAGPEGRVSNERTGVMRRSAAFAAILAAGAVLAAA